MSHPPLFFLKQEAKPFIKWAGGKHSLLPQLQAWLPKTLAGRGYVEPFMGSGAVFFHVLHTRKPLRCTLLDANPELVNLFVKVRDSLEELRPLLIHHQACHNAPGISREKRLEYYLEVRSQRPPPDSVEGAARFLYLNRTCFNGLHRLNSKGQFNVPMGDYRNPRILNEEGLKLASQALQGVRIEACGFQDCERYIQDNDFVYCDPPYMPLSATSSFTAYAKDVFTATHQAQLRDLLIRISPRCQWMLSNSTAPLIKELYQQPGMVQHRVMTTRRINSKAEGRGEIAELVVTSYRVKPVRGVVPVRPSTHIPPPGGQAISHHRHHHEDSPPQCGGGEDGGEEEVGLQLP